MIDYYVVTRLDVVLSCPFPADNLHPLSVRYFIAHLSIVEEFGKSSMVQCCVPFCKSTPGPKVPYSFHEFPVTKIRLEWIRRISRKGNGPTNELWLPSDRSKVCSLHFREEDFRQDLKKRRLLPDAVPSIFPGYPAAMQEARRLSPPQESENQSASSTPQLLVKRPRPKGHGVKTQQAPKRRRLTNALPDALVDSVPLADKIAHAVGEPETEGLAMGNVVAGTSLKSAIKILRKARASAQRPRPKATRKKVLQVTATGLDAERDERTAFFCVPIVSPSAEHRGQTSLVHGKKPLRHMSTLSVVSCTETSEHPAISPALKAVPTACSGTWPSTGLQPLNAAPDCPESPPAVIQAMNKHVGPRDMSALLNAACIEVPSKSSPSVSTAQTVPDLAAKAREQLLPLVDTSTTIESSSNQTLVPVVVKDAKGGAFKPIMLCCESPSSTGAPLTGKLLTVGRLLKRPAAKKTLAVTGSSAIASRPKMPKQLALTRQLVTADKQISRSKPGCASASRKLITENQPETSSSLATPNGFAGVNCSVSSDSSASLGTLLTQDCVAAAGQLGTPGRPLKRTVGSQTLLTRPRLRHLYQRLKTLQRKCLKLQTQKQQLQQELSSTRLEARKAQTFIRELRLTQFKEQVMSGDARCLFLEEQLRCLGQTKHRWREETLQCCLMWHTLSPQGYRIVSQSGLLSLPSCSTLKRHVDAVGCGAVTRGPPSPTGDTVLSAEDAGDDILNVENAMAGATELGSVETVDSASEAGASIGDRLDASMRMAVLTDTRSVSGDQHGDGVDHFAKAFALVTCSKESVEGSDQSLCMTGAPDAKASAAHLSHAERNGLGAESSGERACKQALQVVYVKPSDILDNAEKVIYADPGTTVDFMALTELLPVSAVYQYGISESSGLGVNEQAPEVSAPNGGAGNIEQANVCPTVRSTVLSELPSSVAGRSPLVAVQVSTSSEVAGHCLWLKSPVSCPKPSRKVQLPFSKVGQVAFMATCSGDQCQLSGSLQAKHEGLANTVELPSEDDLLEQVVAPPRGLTELLNTVGASPSTSTSANGASVVGGSVDIETQMLITPTVGLHDKAVELPFLPVGQSPPASLGDEAQALKVVYVDAPAVEGGQYEALSEVVSEALRGPGGEAGQVFQIIYVCSPAATEDQ